MWELKKGQNIFNVVIECPQRFIDRHFLELGISEARTRSRQFKLLAQICNRPPATNSSVVCTHDTLWLGFAKGYPILVTYHFM